MSPATAASPLTCTHRGRTTSQTSPLTKSSQGLPPPSCKPAPLPPSVSLCLGRYRPPPLPHTPSQARDSPARTALELCPRCDEVYLVIEPEPRHDMEATALPSRDCVRVEPPIPHLQASRQNRASSGLRWYWSSSVKSPGHVVTPNPEPRHFIHNPPCPTCTQRAKTVPLPPCRAQRSTASFRVAGRP